MTDILANFLSFSGGFVIGMGVATIIHTMAMASVNRDNDDE